MFQKSSNSLCAALLLLTFIALSGCSGKGGNNTESIKSDSSGLSERLTDEYLNSFGSYDDIPHKYRGHSNPIDIKPDKGVRITAPRNAFKHDTKIEMSGVSDEKFKKMDKKLQKCGVNLLMAYDIDAGLKSDEVMPGTFKVEFDLKKAGIPEELWERLRCYRFDDDGHVLEVSHTLKDGKLSYESAQNSVWGLGAIKAIGSWMWKSVSTAKNWVHGVVFIPIAYALGSTVMRQYFMAPFKQYKNHSTFILNVTDEYGDFNLIYNQQLTENGWCTNPLGNGGKPKDKLLDMRFSELESQAKKEYNRLVRNGKVSDESRELAKIVWSKYQGEVKRQRMFVERRFDQLCASDDSLKHLLSDKYFDIPKSATEMIRLEKLANRFLCKVLGFKKCWYTYDIYMSNDAYMTPPGENEPSHGVTIPFDGWKTFMAVANSKLVGLDEKGKGKTYKPENLNSMLITLCHETFHMKQYQYMASSFLTKDQRFCEATALVLERQFADWLVKEKLITCGARDASLELTDTEDRDWLAWTLEKPIPTNAAGQADAVSMIKSFLGLADASNTDAGYMLGEFILYLLEKKNSKVTLLSMFENYKHSKGFHGMLRDDFGFKSDNEFSIAYQKYCLSVMEKIVNKQSNMANNGALNEGFLDMPKKLTLDNCVFRINNIAMDKKKNKAYAHAIRVFQFKPENKLRKLKYNVFIVPSKAIHPASLFVSLLDKNYQFIKENMFAMINTDHSAGAPVPANVVLLYRPAIDEKTVDDDWWVDVVALFEPEEKPEVDGLMSGGGGLTIDTNVSPPAKNKYITGLQLLVTNKTTAKTVAVNIPVGKCDGSVDVSFEELGVTDRNNINISIRSRWYSRLDEETCYYGPESEAYDYQGKADEKEADALVDVSFKITSHIYGKADVAYKNSPPVYGHLVVKKNKFKFTVPAHKVSYKGGSGSYVFTRTFEFPGISVTGKCRAEYNVKNELNIYYDNMYNNKVKPSTIVIKEIEITKDNGKENKRVVVEEDEYNFNPNNKDYQPTFVDDKDVYFRIPLKTSTITWTNTNPKKNEKTVDNNPTCSMIRGPIVKAGSD